jgi:hypothetical protein
MLLKKFLLPTEQISEEISHFSIGIGRLRVENGVEDVASAGSGTLVTVGSIHGILTAAHVIDALPRQGPVGIITRVDESLRLQAMKIEMALAVPVVIRAETFGKLGPDLGFLRLPRDSIGWLTAKNSFYNLLKYRSDVLEIKAPAPEHVDTVVGVIHELTAAAPGSSLAAKRTLFTTIFCGAEHVAMRYTDKHGLYYFRPNKEIDFSLPENFQGMSGGAVWRFYVTKKQNGELNVVDRRLIAVPFYQSPAPDGKTILTCQGPFGVYGSLIDAVRRQWPDETLRT